jgi:hypothetical protein
MLLHTRAAHMHLAPSRPLDMTVLGNRCAPDKFCNADRKRLADAGGGLWVSRSAGFAAVAAPNSVD